ncbi:hypothetical protein ACA910_012119 [Epithemia clementina (nom. ined.)]
MSSTILYRFRAGTTFEALPLPGSAARLFDVKKAIVLAKKLDQPGSMDFDLSVRDATTDEEFTDENMVLPRGTRLVIQRLVAARGHGFLSRMARHPYGGGGQTGGPASGSGPGANSQFYTISHGDDDEFVSAAAPAIKQEDQELAALRAATDAATQAARNSGVGLRSGQHNHANFRPNIAGQGPPPPPPPQHGRQQGNFVPRQRLNADPELREQEKQLMPKKRATGIPRTFLNLNAPPQTGEGGGVDAEGNTVPLLQPNVIGFEELVNRGGGQSENAGGTMRDLDYALKLTATIVPEYLQCAICHNVVRDAMILPWDPEGRTTCESCIRDALTQNGFRCPLTGQEGVSPDDLLPNHALRKAAEQFVKGVMEKMEEIEKQQVDEDDDAPSGAGDTKGGGHILDGEGADKGVIISKRTSIADRKKKADEDDPFGAGDDLFGGDVFAVANEDKHNDDDDEPAPKAETEKKEQSNQPKDGEKLKSGVVGNEEKTSAASNQQNDSTVLKTESKEHASDEQADTAKYSERVSAGGQQQRKDNRTRSLSPASHNSAAGGREKSPSDAAAAAPTSSRREPRRRGPPIGYSMGPAGGAVSGPREDAIDHTSPRGGRSHNNTNNNNNSNNNNHGMSYGGGDDRDHGDGFRGGRPQDEQRRPRYVGYDKEDVSILSAEAGDDAHHGGSRRNDDFGGRGRRGGHHQDYFHRGGSGRGGRGGRGRGRRDPQYPIDSSHTDGNTNNSGSGHYGGLPASDNNGGGHPSVDHYGGAVDPRGIKRPRSESEGGDGGGTPYNREVVVDPRGTSGGRNHHDDRYGHGGGGGGGGGGGRGGYHSTNNRDRYDPHNGGGRRGGFRGGGGGFQGPGVPGPGAGGGGGGPPGAGGGRGYYEDRGGGGRGGGFRGGGRRGGGGGGGRGGTFHRGGRGRY